MTDREWNKTYKLLYDACRYIGGMPIDMICRAMGQGKPVQLYIGYDQDTDGKEHSIPVLVPPFVYFCGSSEIIIDYILSSAKGYIKEKGGIDKLAAPTFDSHYWCDIS